MMLRISLALLILLSGQSYARGNLSDEQIKQQMIQQSIASYPGNCPCPYNSARNGSSCGRRSAYSKPGGYDPLCYPGDISSAMLENYKKRNGL